MEIGFIGLGNMGNPMARNLIKGGHSLVVHDARKAAAANVLPLGARWADDPRSVASQVEIVFTSLPGPPEVQEVVTGPNGILAGARPGLVLFDLSSNLPSAIRALAAGAKEKGVTVLDAPVSGGTTGAEAGTLSMMVGGDEATFTRHRPILECIANGEKIHYMGAVGNGDLTKALNNMIPLAAVVASQEAFVAGAKAGIPPQKLYDVMKVSSAGAWLALAPLMLKRPFEDQSMKLWLSTKDIGLAVTAGQELGVPMTVAVATHQVYSMAKGMGLGDKNWMATQLFLEQIAGVEVRVD